MPWHQQVSPTFLLAEGFTLVRRGQLLSVIDLSDPRSARQLDALSQLARPEQLDEFEDHEVLKCIFPLGELKPDDALEELSALTFMVSPVAFSKTRARTTLCSPPSSR